MFQHTATRRWLPRIANTTLRDVLTFQHTATRRWLQADGDEYLDYIKVSTHSHPKVAAPAALPDRLLTDCFNTQPPEGGCQAGLYQRNVFTVSTHSHPKVAAEFCAFLVRLNKFVSTHSHPKVAAVSRQNSLRQRSCFNTQPPEGGCPHAALLFPETYRFQHTATRRWLPLSLPTRAAKSGFQHTATRRWLHTAQIQMTLWR